MTEQQGKDNSNGSEPTQIVPATDCILDVIKCLNGCVDHNQKCRHSCDTCCNDLSKFMIGFCSVVLAVCAVIFGTAFIIGPSVITIVVLATGQFDKVLVLFVCSCFMTGLSLIAGIMMAKAIDQNDGYCCTKYIWCKATMLISGGYIIYCISPWFIIVSTSSWVFASSLSGYQHFMVYAPIITFGFGYFLSLACIEGYKNVKSSK